MIPIRAFYRYGPVIAMMTGLVCLGSSSGISLKTLGRVKAATVFIKVDCPEGQAQGSGFVFRRQGRTGYILTNAHVVGGRGKAVSSVTVVFNSGTDQERVLTDAQVIGRDETADLAVIRVRADRLPDPIPLPERSDLSETQSVYIFGFPFGQALSTESRNPAITVTRGSISSLRKHDGELAAVQIDGDLNPGNSGGPVVDEQGQLVGISRAEVRATNIGFAIPATLISNRLQGVVARSNVEIMDTTDRESRLEVWMDLFDPFHQVVSISLLIPARDDLHLSLTEPMTQAQRARATRHMLSYRLPIQRSPGRHPLSVPPRNLKNRASLVYMLKVKYRQGKVNFTHPQRMGVVERAVEYKLNPHKYKVIKIPPPPSVMQPIIIPPGREHYYSIREDQASPPSGEKFVKPDRRNPVAPEPPPPDRFGPGSFMPLSPADPPYLALVRGRPETSAAAAFPIPEASPDGDTGVPLLKCRLTTIDLGSRISGVDLGGGGRYLVVHLDQAGELLVFDVEKAEVLHRVEVEKGHLLFAAGSEELLVLLPGQNLYLRYGLKSGRRELKVVMPYPVLNLAMGSAVRDKALLLLAEGDKAELRNFDPFTLNTQPIASPAFSPYIPVHIRASATGSTYAIWGQHGSTEISTVVKTDAGYQVHRGFCRTPAVPDYQGDLVFGANGIYSREVAGVRPELGNHYQFIPDAAGGDYFLGVRQVEGRLAALYLYDRETPRPLYAVPIPGLPAIEVDRKKTKSDFTSDQRVQLNSRFKSIILIPVDGKQLQLYHYELEPAPERPAK